MKLICIQDGADMFFGQEHVKFMETYNCTKECCAGTNYHHYHLEEFEHFVFFHVSLFAPASENEEKETVMEEKEEMEMA